MQLEFSIKFVFLIYFYEKNHFTILIRFLSIYFRFHRMLGHFVCIFRKYISEHSSLGNLVHLFPIKKSIQSKLIFFVFIYIIWRTWRCSECQPQASFDSRGELFEHRRRVHRGSAHRSVRGHNRGNYRDRESRRGARGGFQQGRTIVQPTILQPTFGDIQNMVRQAIQSGRFHEYVLSVQ